MLDDLFVKQGRAAIDPRSGRSTAGVREASARRGGPYSIYTLHQHRIIPHSSKVKGWTITPSHYLNQQLDTVWLAE